MWRAIALFAVCIFMAAVIVFILPELRKRADKGAVVKLVVTLLLAAIMFVIFLAVAIVMNGHTTGVFQ